MCTIINLDAERAKRGKLRGFTQTEQAMYRHDGYLAPSSMAGRQASYGAAMVDKHIERCAEALRHIADHGDYTQ